MPPLWSSTYKKSRPHLNQNLDFYCKEWNDGNGEFHTIHISILMLQFTLQQSRWYQALLGRWWGCTQPLFLLAVSIFLRIYLYWELLHTRTRKLHTAAYYQTDMAKAILLAITKVLMILVFTGWISLWLLKPTQLWTRKWKGAEETARRTVLGYYGTFSRLHPSKFYLLPRNSLN